MMIIMTNQVCHLLIKYIKYNLIISQNTINTDVTFLDGLLIDLSEKQNVDQEAIKFLIEFMKTHQYDTDSFKYDLIS